MDAWVLLIEPRRARRTRRVALDTYFFLTTDYMDYTDVYIGAYALYEVVSIGVHRCDRWLIKKSAFHLRISAAKLKFSILATDLRRFTRMLRFC